ncbi:MAG: hypothetical protein Q9187_000647 [Circinaria calcarea]
MPGGKIYVVNSPDLAVAVQRHPKTLSFWYLEALFGQRLAALSKEAGTKLMTNVQGEEGEISLFLDGIKFLAKILKPGEGLDHMNRVALQSIAASLAKFEGDGSSRVDLWEWIRHEVTMATTESTYGRMNPYRQEEVETAFWQVVEILYPSIVQLSEYASLLLLGAMPSIFARKGYLGRDKVTAAFERYFELQGYENASPMTKGRHEIMRKHGISVKDMARFEGVQGVTILSNTVPSAFWTLYHVFSRPSVLQSVREEAYTMLSVREEQGITIRTLNIDNIREIPVFASLIQEALRHQALGAGTRMVMEDVLLDSHYLLKKGSFLMMPNAIFHFDESTWGPTVEQFDAKRFIKSKSSGKVHSGAFRAFGGGANLCPGRFFAVTEILSMVAMFALRYDLTPASGEWVAPRPDLANMSFIVNPPKDKIAVTVNPRKGWEHGLWAFEL